MMGKGPECPPDAHDWDRARVNMTTPGFVVLETMASFPIHCQRCGLLDFWVEKA